MKLFLTLWQRDLVNRESKLNLPNTDLGLTFGLDADVANVDQLSLPTG